MKTKNVTVLQLNIVGLYIFKKRFNKQLLALKIEKEPRGKEFLSDGLILEDEKAREVILLLNFA